jgi:hypothetical protein
LLLLPRYAGVVMVRVFHPAVELGNQPVLVSLGLTLRRN